MLKKIIRFLAIFIVPFAGYNMMRFLYLTNKIRYFTPKNFSEENIIFAFWHGNLLMTAYAYRRLRKKSNCKILISDHFDGTLISQIAKYFGFGSIRGSSNKNAAKVLINAIKEIRNGADVGITPDGPKGPRHEVADGIVVMAQKTNKKIALIEVRASSFWQLNSWDKFVIPRPFGTIDFYVSEPIDIKDMNIDEAKNLIKSGLLKHENVYPQRD